MTIGALLAGLAFGFFAGYCIGYGRGAKYIAQAVADLDRKAPMPHKVLN